MPPPQQVIAGGLVVSLATFVATEFLRDASMPHVENVFVTYAGTATASPVSASAFGATQVLVPATPWPALDRIGQVALQPVPQVIVGQLLPSKRGAQARSNWQQAHVPPIRSHATLPRRSLGA